jgi:probable blue pigment (indigoidine) exporter
MPDQPHISFPIFRYSIAPQLILQRINHVTLKRTSVNYLITGLTFSILWASASIAGKFGLQSVEALLFFTLRFLGAGLLLLFYVYAIKRDRLPAGKEWINVSVFGALSTTLYLGLFILALQSVAAGITALAVALNPLLISILSSLWMKRKVKNREWLSICLGIAGVAVATYPLLHTVHASIEGLILISLSMVAYSVGTVYYSSVIWKLPRITINAWQGLIGGLLLLPFTILFYRGNNHFDLNFWLSLAWLTIIVSIFTVQLWLHLLSDDPVRASLWLFLCPVFGIAFATLLLHEPFLIHTAIGSAIVLSALYLGQERT